MLTPSLKGCYIPGALLTCNPLDTLFKIGLQGSLHDDGPGWCDERQPSSCNHIIMIATLLPTWRCDYKTFGLIFKSNQCFVNESSSRNKVAVGELVSGITYSWYLFSDLVTSDPRNEFSTGIMITRLVDSYLWRTSSISRVTWNILTVHKIPATNVMWTGSWNSSWALRSVGRSRTISTSQLFTLHVAGIILWTVGLVSSFNLLFLVHG